MSTRRNTIFFSESAVPPSGVSSKRISMTSTFGLGSNQIMSRTSKEEGNQATTKTVVIKRPMLVQRYLRNSSDYSFVPDF